MRLREIGPLALLPFVIGAWWPQQAATAAAEACVVEDPAIVESSGLVVTDRWFVTVNDSGDASRVFVLDRRTCDTVGETTWTKEPWDVEALAPDGDDAVWVGDIGDNLEDRDEIEAVRVPIAEGDRTTSVQTRVLRYPDGPHNAESLLTEPGTGRLVVITKDVLGGHAYAVPRGASGVATTLEKQEPSLLPVATDAAFFPDGEHLVVRNYRLAVVYSWPALEKVGQMVLPSQPQGEGIAVEGDRLFISSEGTRQPIVEVGLPRAVRKAMGLEVDQPADDRTPRDRADDDEAADAGSPLGSVDPMWVAGGAAALVVVAGALWVRRRSGRRR